MYMYILYKIYLNSLKFWEYILETNIIVLFYRNYHLQPSTKGVYPVQLTDENYVDFHWQTFVQNGIYKNHFFDYEDTHAKHIHREMILLQV